LTKIRSYRQIARNITIKIWKTEKMRTKTPQHIAAKTRPRLQIRLYADIGAKYGCGGNGRNGEEVLMEQYSWKKGRLGPFFWF